MTLETKTFKPKNQARLLIRRPGALAIAFAGLAEQLGIDTANAKFPAIYEPAISTPPRPKRKKR